MKLTIRTLQNSTFAVTIEPSNTVLELKQAISQLQENILIERQKLIHSGRILVDDKQLSSYEVKDGDFIVLMITKPTIASPSSATNVAVTEKKETPVAVSSSATSSAVSAELNAALDRIVEMGFDREEATKALKAAFMNIDRAVEYLSSGIIPKAEEQPSTASTSTSALTPELEALKNSPGFQQLRAAVQQNPDLLYYVIDQIAETNPQLLTMIEQNREAFFRLLTGDDTLTLQSEPEEDEEPGETAVPTEGNEEGEEEELFRDEVEQQMFEQAVIQQLNASPEDASAIQRIMDMGFDRNAAIEAYFACDKNEELAINFLLNQQQ